MNKHVTFCYFSSTAIALSLFSVIMGSISKTVVNQFKNHEGGLL